jgi:hypothetical protein
LFIQFFRIVLMAPVNGINGNATHHRLTFIPLRDCPALTGPAARIMTESSPMYAWVEDIVPKQQCVAVPFELALA